METGGRGLGGGWGAGDRAMLIDPTVQQQVPARVCVWVSTQDLTKSWAQSTAPRGAAKEEPLEPQRGA